MVLLNSRQDDGFSPMSKRPKVDAVRSFPGRYGATAFKMDPKESDDHVVVDRPPPRKHPPPRILNDFPVKRDFPAGCGKQNSGSVSKNRISSNGKSIPDSKQLEVIVPGKYAEEISLPPLLRDKECGEVGISQESRIVLFDDHRGKVKEVLNQFQKLFTKLSGEQEGKPKWRDGSNVHVAAAKTLKMQRKCVNISKRLGPVPGVQVGDVFQWRAELYVIGLHHQFSGGIDYLKKDGKILATCVVASGRYANVESSNVLIYLGHGGNPSVSSMPPVDQKLERGNLALKNSMEAMTPVRVIRGNKFSMPSLVMDAGGKRSQTSYVYDGLYLVEKFWQERGEFSKLVFKFLLRRISGQQKLKWEKLSKTKNSTFQREGSYVNDICQRKEKIPIPMLSTKDDKKTSFLNQIYDATYLELDNKSMPSGCDCTDGCLAEDCACTVKNGGEIPYNYKTHVKAKPHIYECGPSRERFTSCINRVSQRGTR